MSVYIMGAAMIDRTGSQPLERCAECGAEAPVATGPVHAYMPASAGCWAVFGRVQADELTRFGYPPAHRLVVGAYAAQHPGDGKDRRARQSVFVHLVGLCAVLERGAEGKRATEALRRALAGRPDFPVLKRSSGPGELTIVSMEGAVELDDYTERARDWAHCVWASWAEHHHQIRDWIDRP
jgi:hypothetical protein